MNRGHNTGRTTLDALDGLRAVAAIAVFCVHFRQEADFYTAQRLPHFDINLLIENGNTGVALFFVLSGFLLSLPFWHCKNNASPSPSIANYWKRRFFRIAPAYYLCLTVLLLENGYWRSSDELSNVLAHYLFVFNYSDEWFYSINPPFWTIAIEVQFYFLLPLIFLFTAKLNVRATAFCVVAFICGGYILHIGIMEHESQLSSAAQALGFAHVRGVVLSKSLVAHLPHFLLGVAAGSIHTVWLQPTVDRKGLTYDVAFWLCALFVITILSTRLDDTLSLPHGRFNFPFVPIALGVIVITAPYARTAKFLLCNFPVRWLGTVSYGVYLLHLPILKVTAKIFPLVDLHPGSNWLSFAMISFSLTVIVASGSYVIFERPLLKRMTNKEEALTVAA